MVAPPVACAPSSNSARYSPSFMPSPSGFIAYQVAHTGERTVASITMFHERDQAERSDELAAEWVAESLADFDVERMGVMGGEVMVSRAVADLPEPAHH
jgi:hypothetical protein